MNRWLVEQDEDGNKHVVPIKDEKEHDLDEQCWCRPRHDKDDKTVIIHRSKDRREDHELH